MEEVKDLKEELRAYGGQKTLSKRLEHIECMSSVEGSVCIYRVHDGLRNAENEAHYKPLLVSIGPYHHGNQKFSALMQQHKLRFLNLFLKRTGKSLNWCRSIVEKNVHSALECYAGPIRMTRSEFEEMMLLDSCFIIEFLFRLKGNDWNDDPLLKVPWMASQVVRDFLLLENQVPFFLPFQLLSDDDTPQSSSELIEAAKFLATGFLQFKLSPSQPPQHHFLDPVKIFLGKILKYCSPTPHHDHQTHDVERQQSHPRINGNVEYKHFLDLVTKICVPSNKEAEEKKKKNEEEEEETCTLGMPCVKELHQGSIAFEVNESNNVTLFDIEFHRSHWFRCARLKIPCLTIDDYTETLLRNIIAYEQHNSEAEFRYFTDYTYFLDNLINSEEDVTYLRLNKIINNMLGDDKEVATLINRLGNGRIIDENTYYYSRVCQQVNDHYGRCWNQFMATLRRKYLNNPWAWISTLAGLLLLILTTTATVLSLINALT